MSRGTPLAVLVALLVGHDALHANDTIVVAQHRYVVDTVLDLVLVAADVQLINGVHPGSESVITLDRHFSFASQITDVEIGVEYSVVDTAGTPYTLYFTDLPLIWIDTPHTIVDEPKVDAVFRMIAPGEEVPVCDIGVEYRGASSQTFPKKSYRIGFRSDALGTSTRDVSLLGMRSDDDWNLNAVYNEPLRMRSKLGQELWMDIHAPHYAGIEPEALSGVRMAHVELILNGRYNGVYTLGEPVDRKQLRLKSFNGNVRGKLYKAVDWAPGVEMTGVLPYDNNSLTWAGFEYEYPEEVVDWSDLHAFVSFVVTSGNVAFTDQFPLHFHLDNAVDYFLLLNLMRAVDNTSKNTYIARHNAYSGYFYVPWDLDGTFSRVHDGTVDTATTSMLFNGMYQRLRWDCAPDGFMQRARQRWAALREGAFSAHELTARFHDAHEDLARTGVYAREELAWSGYTYDPGELERVAQWIDQRTAYMDAWFLNTCSSAAIAERFNPDELQLYPNPARDRVFLESDVLRPGMSIALVDALGRAVRLLPVSSGRASVDLGGVVPGLYRLNLMHEGRLVGGKALVVE